MPYANNWTELEDRGMMYVPLRDVIEDFFLTLDEDDYVRNANDVVVRNTALRGIREFGFDVTSRVKSIKGTIASNNTVSLPDDFVDLIKIGVVDSDGVVRVLNQNKNLNMSRRLKTTTDYNNQDQDVLETDETLSSDSQGSPLGTGNGGHPDNTIADTILDKGATTGLGSSENDFEYYIFENYLYQGGMGRVYGAGGAHMRGQYRINYDEARIELDTENSISEVVMEYVSDEARSTNPIVHVYAEEALRSYIYYKLVERKSNVPLAEKSRARQEYYNERRKAKARMSNFSKAEALSTIRKNFKIAPKY
jgi:hypothetical protein